MPFLSKAGQRLYRPSGGLSEYDRFFYGYFRCLNRCVAGGFPLWFAKLMGISPVDVPGYDPDREILFRKIEYPIANINNEINSYQDRLGVEILARFQKAGIGPAVLAELKIGYNDRYLVYPYVQEYGNCYAARCVFSERQEDFFWHGDEQFFADQHHIYNIQDIQRCENGALFVCQGEENLLALKQLGFPGVAVPDCRSLELLDPERFAFVQMVFIVMENNAESEAAARTVAAGMGYKARLFRWPTLLARNYNLWQFRL